MKPMLYSLCFCAAICCSNAQRNSPETHESNYFIGTPENTTVSINDSNDTEEIFGDFSCATRLNYRPLWIVNGFSIDIIRAAAGYSGTYIELIPLPGEGNFLSFVSIPASAATNNSIISCAAVHNDTILAYAKPAHMIVLKVNPSTTVSPSPSPSELTSSMASGTDPTVKSPDPSKAGAIKWIICLSVVCGSLICIAVVTFISILIYIAFRRQQNFKKISIMNKPKGKRSESNVYSRGDGKEQTTNKLFWDQECEKKFAVKESL